MTLHQRCYCNLEESVNPYELFGSGSGKWSGGMAHAVKQFKYTFPPDFNENATLVIDPLTDDDPGALLDRCILSRPRRWEYA